MNDPARQPDTNPDAHLDALFALARTHRPDTSAAEYAFETRLLAHLRDAREPDSDTIWAKVSWRLVPFFAVCVIALTLWHSEVLSETHDAEQSAYMENSDTLDSWNNLD